MNLSRAISAASVLLLCGAGPASQTSEVPFSYSDPYLNWGDNSKSIGGAGTQPSVYIRTSPAPASLYLLLRTEDITAGVFVALDGAQPTVYPVPYPTGNIRNGSITFSDGQVVKGGIYMPGQVLWGRSDDGRDFNVPLINLRSIEVVVVSEAREPDASGGTYPVRVTKYKLTKTDGSTITGDVTTPVYSNWAGNPSAYFLQKEQKGEVGEAMKEMVYVRFIRFLE
jgi:hypothetical protein